MHICNGGSNTVNANNQKVQEMSELTDEERAKQREMEKIIGILRDYNIEVKITDRNHRKQFEWRNGQGNLGKGIIRTNRFVIEKLGVDLEKLMGVCSEDEND